MSMLHNVTAEIRKDEIGLESTTTTTLSVIHPVVAEDEEQACSLLEEHYKAKSEQDSPYGTRYYVQEVKAFPCISADTLKRPTPR